MLKLKRHLSKKLILTYNSQLGRLWISLTFITILCVALQILGNLQPTCNCRCDQKLKRLALQQNTSNEIPLLQETGTSSACHFPKPPDSGMSQNMQAKMMVRLSSTESLLSITELGQTSSQIQASSADNPERTWNKSHEERSKDVGTLHATKRLKSQVPKRDHVARTGAPLPSRKPTTKAEKAFSKKPDLAAGITAREQTSRSPFRKVTGSFQSQSEATVSPTSHGKGSSSTSATRVILEAAEKLEATTPLSMGRESLQSKNTVPRSGGGGGDALTQCLPANFSSSRLTVCKPKTHVVFLKVHKSASSTVMNILFRFGETHNLTFALPTNDASQLGYPYYFLAEFVEGFSSGNMSDFNILCHHMRFLKAQVQRLMPSSTFYFSILRNPVHLMESSFTYYKGLSPFARARSLEEFLSQPAKFYNASTRDSHYAKNLMAFDFGFNHNANFSASHTQQMLQNIEKAFDLLLVSEYFDESMVLLKKALCWDLDSIVSFRLNSREQRARAPLSENMTAKIKSWNRLDWAIYTHFNRTFWERVDRDVGRKCMEQEVRALRERREQLAKSCLQGGGSVGPPEIRDKSLAPLQHGRARILGYNLKAGLDEMTGRMCRRMVTPELQYSHALYRKQFPEKAQRLHRAAQPPRIRSRGRV